MSESPREYDPYRDSPYMQNHGRASNGLILACIVALLFLCASAWANGANTPSM